MHRFRHLSPRSSACDALPRCIRPPDVVQPVARSVQRRPACDPVTGAPMQLPAHPHYV